MRFDDSLKTVLAADSATVFGAQAAWRQLVDLAGRGRIATNDDTLARLAALREAVPLPVRAASARALAQARPDAALVGFFAADELPVSAPVLRLAGLEAEAWLALLPRLTPAGRAVLRGRRDLPQAVVRGLESLGRVDFTLPYDAPVDAASDETVAAQSVDSDPLSQETAPVELVPEPKPEVVEVPPVAPGPAAPAAPRSPSPFVRLGDVAQRLPLVAEARRRAGEPAERFEIADIVARIDAFRRDQPLPTVVAPPAPSNRFEWETDATGVIRWIDVDGRASLVGVSLAQAGGQGLVRVDAGVAGAVSRRSRIAEGRLEIDGEGDLAGSWRLVASPTFDPASGRFTGYAGSATRAARHQRAERGEATDGLRELVHELRTPANAVAGFAEFIEAELLGPVPEIYRARAADIRGRAADLLAAIDDLDTAARIDGAALELRAGEVSLAALVAQVAASLRPLAQARGATLVVRGEAGTATVDERAAERLVARLLAALLSVAGRGETLPVDLLAEARELVVAAARPAALAGRTAETLLTLGTDADETDGAPLLGLGFTLRLVRNLAREVGGTLAIEPARLTLRLPAALSSGMGQAANH